MGTGATNKALPLNFGSGPKLKQLFGPVTILKDFVDVIWLSTFQYVRTAVEWAPATVLSHLQEYINTMTHDTGLTHTGVTFAVECILHFSGQSDQVRAVQKLPAYHLFVHRGRFAK